MDVTKKENKYYSYSNAILALEPSAKFSFTDPNDLSTLEWLDDEVTRPTDAAIQTQYDADMAVRNSKQYVLDRQSAYPSIADQLDMIFHAGLGGDEFQAAIQAVKDANPKPE